MGPIIRTKKKNEEEMFTYLNSADQYIENRHGTDNCERETPFGSVPVEEAFMPAIRKFFR